MRCFFSLSLSLVVGGRESLRRQRGRARRGRDIIEMVMRSRVARKSLPHPFRALGGPLVPFAAPHVAIIIIMLSAVDVVRCYALFGAHAQLVESLRVCGNGKGFSFRMRANPDYVCACLALCRVACAVLLRR